MYIVSIAVVVVVVVVVCIYNSSFMIIKKLYVFGWPAWLTSGFSGNLSYLTLFNVVYCRIHRDYCLSQINTFFFFPKTGTLKRTDRHNSSTQFRRKGIPLRRTAHPKRAMTRNCSCARYVHCAADRGTHLSSPSR